MARPASKHSRPHPDLRPCHPGEILREMVLPAVDKPLGQLAKALGIIQKQFSDLVNEKTSLSPELAIRLEAAFGRSAPAWMRMQETYDLWHARRAIDTSGIPRFEPAA
jgi:antitoxin HigA-1